MLVRYRVFAMFVAGALTAFAVYYPYKFLVESWPLAFSGPESWQAYWWVADDVLVPFRVRLIQWLVFVPTALATQAFLIGAIALVVMLLRGEYLTGRVVRLVTWVGGFAALAGVFSNIGMMFNPWLLTLYSPNQATPIMFRYDSGEIGVLLAGLGLFLAGQVLRLGLAIDTENKEFV